MRRSAASMKVRLGSAVVALAACGGLSACGGGDAPAVAPGDAAAIFRALERSQPVSPQACGSVSRPLSPSTRAAYALMIRVSAVNPEAELQSPDSTDHHPPIRSWLSTAARAIADCRAEVPTTGPGWRALETRVERAAGAGLP